MTSLTTDQQHEVEQEILDDYITRAISRSEAIQELVETCGYEPAEADALIEEALDNYEPPDPLGWGGGFADNH